MTFRPLLFFASLAMIASALSNPADAAETREYYEVRSYVLGDKGDAAAINAYLKDALIPALKRQGVGPVGVFTNAANDETGSPRIVTVIPYESADQIATIEANVQADPQFQTDAKAYLDRGPKDSPYARISSELLVSMACMPAMAVPEGTLDNDDRVYELRVYESANERLGHLKVDMFNSGEVPIFLDSNITPIFIGQAIVGPQTPNLTYLTMYPSEADRVESWKVFLAHPDWQVLKAVKKYQGTVSRIDKFLMVPTAYSGM